MKCLASLLIISTFSCHAADSHSAKNIPYQSIPGVPRIRQLLDVHYDKDDTKTKNPVILWVHGGAWKFGDKSRSLHAKPKAFTQAGYVTVALNYRFHPAASWQEQADDVARAAKWLTSHISNYGGDPRRIILMGHSAGAHLAALTGADPSYLKKAGVFPSSIKAVVLLDGAGYDIPLAMTTSHGQHLKLYQTVFGNDPATLKAASPVSHFKKGRTYPAYLAIPIAMRPKSVTQSRNLVAKIKTSGSIAEVFIAKNRTHSSLNRKIGEPMDAPTQAILMFLKKQLPAGIP